MTEEKSWLGEWSFGIEGIDEIELFGNLSYAPNGKFVLEASMKQAPFDIIFNLQRTNKVNYIVGLDYKTQKNLTLVDSILISNKWSTSGGNSFKISPTLLIEGFYYDSENPLLFNQLVVKYSGLNQWLRVLSEVKMNIDYEDTLTLTYKRSKSINCQIDDFLDLSIHFDYYTKQENINETGFFLTENISTVFKSRQGEIAIEIFSRYSEHFRRLLQILYYQPAFLLSSTIEKASNKETYPLYHDQVHKRFFNNYTTHIGYLCNYRDLINFPDILSKWFAYRKSDDYTYITWVASKHLFINTPFSEEVFLENVRVLEVYHKAKYPKNSKRQEQNTHLKERLWALLTKLKGLVDQNDYDNFIEDENDFITVLIENRNYLTHYGENSTTSKNLLTVPQLYWYAVKSRVVLLSHLLNDIGIDAKQVFGNLAARHK